MAAPPEEIVKILAVLGIKIKTEKDLFGVLIHRDDLLRVDIEQKLAEFIDSLKEKYKSSKLNCLHENRESKQKFPGINLIRQILKCNGYHLKPVVFSKGYSKHNGKKLVERNFKVIRLQNYAEIKQSELIHNTHNIGEEVCTSKPQIKSNSESMSGSDKNTLLNMYDSLEQTQMQHNELKPNIIELNI
jgi:hypothetical protein